MQVIIADVLPQKVPGFATPDLAIQSAQQFDEDRQTKELPLVIGRQVDSVEFGDDVVRVYCGQHGISFYQKEGSIEYEIFCGTLSERLGTQNLGDTVEVELRGRRFLWERRQILNHLVGQTLRKVFLSPVGLFLYASNIDILLVSPLLDLERSRPFLFWQFSD